MSKKLTAEAIGTFFLVFTIGMVVLDPGAGAFAGLAIGTVLAIMVYATGHISGAHLNPAVTASILIRGKTTPAELVGYWIAQVLGASLAAFAVLYLKGEGGTAMVLSVGPALVAEFVFTFALVFVILNVATARGTEGNSYFGAAIGGTVMAGVYAVGAISGAAFNPAVAIGIVIMGLVAPADLWIYFVATFAGGACAALLFKSLDMGGDGDAA